MSRPAAFPFEEAIAARAARSGVDLTERAVRALAAHARAVLGADDRLHLTAIQDPELFLERHVGESLEGASLLADSATGTLLDLGSGNGYPGLPLGSARPGLRVVLAEASARKAEFLRSVLATGGFEGASVREGQVQRAADLASAAPVAVLATRAAGGWQKVLPRLASILTPAGSVLVWAGEDLETIRRRVAWTRFELVDRRLLPGRDRSWVWLFRRRA